MPQTSRLIKTVFLVTRKVRLLQAVFVLARQRSLPRGFGLKEMGMLAAWMADVMDSVTVEGQFDQAVCDRVKGEVVDLCAQFPVYDYND